MKKYRNAFTTAEVLITLLILGVISTLTMITLKQDTAGREKVLRVKKAYSVVSNAYDTALTEFGPTYEWDSMGPEAFSYKIGKSLNLAKDCGIDNTLKEGNECIPDCPKIYKAGSNDSLDVCSSSQVSKMRTADGFSYAFQIEDPICSVDVTNKNENAPKNMKEICGTFLIDIDSSRTSKNRNLYGRDLFLFYVTREGIIPTGLDVDVKYPQKDGECKQTVIKDEFGCSALMVYGDNKLEN